MSSAIPLDAPLEINATVTSSGSIARLFGHYGPRPMMAPEDGSGSGDLIGDDGAAAFLDSFKDAETPADEEEEKEKDEEAPPEDDEKEEAEEAESDDSEDDEGEDDEDSDKAEKKALKDSDIVKVKVDGKELDVPVESLKRLYGQEAALTRKSQEVADRRKAVDDTGAYYVAASEKLLERARQRTEPYAKIDWILAAQELSGDEYKAVRDQAQAAYQDVQYLESEVKEFLNKTEQERYQQSVSEAKATIKELSDPKTGIGLNDALYEEMRTYATSIGIPSDSVNDIVSAPVLRLVHKAMMYDKGKARVQDKTKLTDKRPKTIIKSKVTADASREGFRDKGPSKAMSQLRKTGSMDDAEAAFLARMSD